MLLWTAHQWNLNCLVNGYLCNVYKTALDCGNDHHAGQAGEESNGSNLEILFIGLDIQPRETLWKLQLNLTIIKSISVGYYPHKHMETKVCLECVCFFNAIISSSSLMSSYLGGMDTNQ